MVQNRIDSNLLGVLGIGCVISAIEPFDVIFASVTAGSAAWRIVLCAILVIVGARAAAISGLRIEGHGARYPALIGVAGAAFVAFYCVALDRFVFRSVLPSYYEEFLRQPLSARLTYFLLRSFVENIFYRLFLFSALLALLTALRFRSGCAIFAAMVASQCVNIWCNVASFEQLTGLVLLYDAFRYVAPGLLWAEIYRRYGFVTNEVAAVGCHVFLQPMFS